MRRSTCAIAALSLAVGHSAHAEDARCARPPFGASNAEYQAFKMDVGRLFDDPAATTDRMFKAVCNNKFTPGFDRTALHHLGFSDQKIDQETVGNLAMDTVVALKKAVGD